MNRITAAVASAALLAAAPALAQQTEGAQGGQTTQEQGQLAQEAQPQGQAGQAQPGQTVTVPAQTGQATGQASQAQAPQTEGGQQPAPGAGADTLVATVGEGRITGGDVMAMIGALPPQLRQQPPEMLVPMAVDSLVLRELIVQEARAQNLAEDPEVQALVETAGQAAQEDAMVQVYLQRELGSRVTDEAVQQAYDAVAQTAQGQLPPLEQVRPQIEQQLQQQALQGLRAELEGDVVVVFYGPDGRPMQAGAGGQAGGSPSTGGTQTGGGQTGGATGGGQATQSPPAGAAPSGDQQGADQSGGEQSTDTQ